MIGKHLEYSDSLPSSWSVKTVGEIGSYLNGFAFKPTQWGSEGLPIIRIQNLNDRNKPFNYYDGQGFLVPKKLKITSAKQLKSAEICVQSGATTEKNQNDYFKGQNIKIKSVVFEGFEASVKAFFSGRCQAYTTDASGLASIRNKEAKDPKEHVILPELISKEPLGPSVRRGDDEFFTIAKWVVFALIEAEDYGVTQANVDAMSKTTDNPAIGRLLGSTEDTGKLLGLEPLLHHGAEVCQRLVTCPALGPASVHRGARCNIGAPLVSFDHDLEPVML